MEIDGLSHRFLKRYGVECAYTVITPGQIFRYAVICGGVFLFANYRYDHFLLAANFVVCGVYLAIVVFRFFTVFLSLLADPSVKIPVEDLGKLEPASLPPYTVLVPLYREGAVVADIVKAVKRLDYPADKLEVIFLLEPDDDETTAALEKEELPDGWRVLCVPDALPRTKPKACNYGLEAAKGEFIVVFDAEDRPEPDQLKKAVAAFSRFNEKVACLQAKLNFYNPFQNLLTMWFTMEYTVWFDLFLPGLHLLGLPIPLGGTSNHFRTTILKKIGGWDPFNVTEDCDLGIRLYRMGYSTRVLDSTTWEEANSRVGNWLKQRSRWVKGYIQTHLVHTRDRLRLLRQLGLKGYLGFTASVGGLAFTFLLNPVYWAAAVCFLFIRWRILYPDDLLSVVFYYVTWILAVGNGLFVAVNVLGCMRRCAWRLVPCALLSPLYWVMMSIGAWKGFLQIFRDPFYWEKTVHGLVKGGNTDDPVDRR